ncbi:sorting nexin associated protein 1 [Capsaspora owczarzaki ATCC 30864]|uniref:Sorting nexin associated protein 1 n=1 Tax=Capsaspora owczarzaki (strain ATCC 30864) TaxID=595528 RepID=A0A0D2WS53_CAPO3|nr:sorting nexin associated protein 1 [Capsaspora owczarzaki ATCC 30864]
MTQARALYDYEGGEGELSFFTDNVIQVTDKGSGDGWWMGVLNGQMGYFPESYLPSSPAARALPSRALPVPTAAAAADDEENWDDDDAEPVPATRGATRSTSNASSAGYGTAARRGTVRRNLNRFSAFVKTGGEAFLMAESIDKVPSDLVVRVVAGPRWLDAPQYFSVSVTEPTKKSKFHGVKSFIAYNVMPSHTGVAVSRRYKHFDWLYERLTEKFASLSIPPLPDKSAMGRYEEEFIKLRQQQLQRWLTRLARHPVISQCEALNHFLTCNGEEKEWKAGKRKAEKDECIGGKFFMCISAPDGNVPPDADTQVESFGKFVRGMERRMDKVRECGERFSSFSQDIKTEVQRVGHAFGDLTSDDWKDEGHPCTPLTKAIEFTSTTLNEIGQSFADQPAKDMTPLLADTAEYLGILPTYPSIVDTHTSAYNRLKETTKLQEQGKADGSDVAAVQQRCEVISNVTLSELDRFHTERNFDTKLSMETYLASQIEFYQQIVGKLQNALQKFQDIPQ